MFEESPKMWVIKILQVQVEEGIYFSSDFRIALPEKTYTRGNAKMLPIILKAQSSLEQI